jgi:hypothetical protein
VKDGDFSLKHSFANYGTHKVILRVDTNSSITPAAFDVVIPSYPSSSSPFLVDSDKSKLDKDNTRTKSFTIYLIIGVGVALSIGMTINIIINFKEKIIILLLI